jgi:predicted CXXCH cytochrome family protein
VIQVQGGGGASFRQEIAVPPLKTLAEVKDSGLPPVVSAARVLKIERGLFLSATIGWQTDTITDALVSYGTKDLSQTSQPSQRFGHRHEVILYDLKPDKTYHASIISRDLFGRRQTSEALTFSTAKALTAAQSARSANLPESEGEPRLTSNFRRVGTGYLLELALDRPAWVYVGAGGMPRKPEPPVGSTGVVGGEDDKFHEGLSTRQVASLEACQGCHENQATATHPVNVFPKPGMIIPPEYPTLPDGRITCRSCHEPHSSENEFLAVKPDKRELCVGCHRDML